MKKLLLIASALASLAISPSALAIDADANPIFTNRVIFGLGGFYAKTDATIGAELNDSDLGAELDFDDIGLDESVMTGMAYALLRISNRWRLEFDFTNVENDGSGSVEAIDVGGIVIPVDADVTTYINTRFISTRLGFSVVRNETAELGVSLGVSATSIEAGIGGSIEGIGSGRYDVTADVPLPTLGIYGTLALTDKLSLGGRAGILSIELGDDEGTLYDLFASVDYFFTKNFGLGVGYKFVRADVKVQEENYRQLYDIRQSGPVAYLTLGFGS